MITLLLLFLCAISRTQALWLAVQSTDYNNPVYQTGVYGSPYCMVGKGNTAEEAVSKAHGGLHFDTVALIAGGHCNQMPYQHTKQLGGFWNDYGTVNYEDSNWHWYCFIDGAKYSSGVCNAGRGAPKRKREIAFSA